MDFNDKSMINDVIKYPIWAISTRSEPMKSIKMKYISRQQYHLWIVMKTYDANYKAIRAIYTQ